jgi:predicted ribonuclease YlaK
MLDRLSSYGDIHAGMDIPTGGRVRVTADHEGVDDLDSAVDNKVVGTALRLKTLGETNVILLTTDSNMRVTTRARGIGSEGPHGLDDLHFVPETYQDP